MRKPTCNHVLGESVDRVNVGRNQDGVESGADEACPAIIAFARREKEFPQLIARLGRPILLGHFSCFGN